jgi:hypothetical protein
MGTLQSSFVKLPSRASNDPEHRALEMKVKTDSWTGMGLVDAKYGHCRASSKSC